VFGKNGFSFQNVLHEKPQDRVGPTVFKIIMILKSTSRHGRTSRHVTLV